MLFMRVRIDGALFKGIYSVDNILRICAKPYAKFCGNGRNGLHRYYERTEFSSVDGLQARAVASGQNTEGQCLACSVRIFFDDN